MVMQLSVQSVLSAAECIVGGGTIISFRLTTALDYVQATNDKYVLKTCVTTKHIEEYTRTPNMKEGREYQYLHHVYRIRTSAM